MDVIFDLANIAAGLILGVGVLKSFNINLATGLTVFLGLYRWIFGAVCLVLGVYFILHAGYLIHDIVGILAGLLLLADRLEKIPGIGSHLKDFSKVLTPFEAIIGIAALVVGILGLLNIGLLA